MVSQDRLAAIFKAVAFSKSFEYFSLVLSPKNGFPALTARVLMSDCSVILYSIFYQTE